MNAVKVLVPTAPFYSDKRSPRSAALRELPLPSSSPEPLAAMSFIAVPLHIQMVNFLKYDLLWEVRASRWGGLSVEFRHGGVTLSRVREWDIKTRNQFSMGIEELMSCLGVRYGGNKIAKVLTAYKHALVDSSVVDSARNVLGTKDSNELSKIHREFDRTLLALTVAVSVFESLGEEKAKSLYPSFFRSFQPLTERYNCKDLTGLLRLWKSDMWRALTIFDAPNFHGSEPLSRSKAFSIATAAQITALIQEHRRSDCSGIFFGNFFSSNSSLERQISKGCAYISTGFLLMADVLSRSASRSSAYYWKLSEFIHQAVYAHDGRECAPPLAQLAALPVSLHADFAQLFKAEASHLMRVEQFVGFYNLTTTHPDKRIRTELFRALIEQIEAPLVSSEDLFHTYQAGKRCYAEGVEALSCLYDFVYEKRSESEVLAKEAYRKPKLQAQAAEAQQNFAYVKAAFSHAESTFDRLGALLAKVRTVVGPQIIGMPSGPFADDSPLGQREIWG